MPSDSMTRATGETPATRGLTEDRWAGVAVCPKCSCVFTKRGMRYHIRTMHGKNARLPKLYQSREELLARLSALEGEVERLRRGKCAVAPAVVAPPDRAATPAEIRQFRKDATPLAAALLSVAPPDSDRAADVPEVITLRLDPEYNEYDKAITDLLLAKGQRDSIARGEAQWACAICEDTGHCAEYCHHNPLNQAREGVASRVTWQCFHCGVSFTDEDLAREHFGTSEDEVVRCLSRAAVVGSERRAPVQFREPNEPTFVDCPNCGHPEHSLAPCLFCKCVSVERADSERRADSEPTDKTLADLQRIAGHRSLNLDADVVEGRGYMTAAKVLRYVADALHNARADSETGGSQ